jgi:hypothetical protein
MNIITLTFTFRGKNGHNEKEHIVTSVVQIVSRLSSPETCCGHAWFRATLEVLVRSRSMRAVCLLHAVSLSLLTSIVNNLSPSRFTTYLT